MIPGARILASLRYSASPPYVSRVVADPSGRAMFVTDSRFNSAWGWHKTLRWYNYTTGSNSVYPVKFSVVKPVVFGHYTTNAPVLATPSQIRWVADFYCIKPTDTAYPNQLWWDLQVPFAIVEIPAYFLSAGWDVITGVCVHMGDPAVAFSANFFFTGMTRFFLVQPTGSGIAALDSDVVAACPFSSPLANGTWHRVANQNGRTDKTRIAIVPDWFDPLMAESGYAKNPYNPSGYTGSRWTRIAMPTATWSGRMPSITVRIQKSAVLDAQGVTY